MNKIGIFYGSSTGSTKDAAEKIAAKMNVEDKDVHDVAASKPSDVSNYDVLVFGTSTWGSGELQDNWYDFLSGIEVLDLKDKIIALFGCGDESMSDTFNDAVGEIYKRLQATGAKFIGKFDASVYDFNHSAAVIDGMGVGLLLDQDNRPELTDGRIEAWTREVLTKI